MDCKTASHKTGTTDVRLQGGPLKSPRYSLCNAAHVGLSNLLKCELKAPTQNRVSSTKDQRYQWQSKIGSPHFGTVHIELDDFQNKLPVIEMTPSQ